MDPVDENVREALLALEAQGTPRDYFDELPGRIEAKLDARLAEAPMEAVPTKNDENSGLHDIKALAQSQRMRISRRQTSQHDVEDAMMSSSQSGMRAIALPDPAKIVSLPSPEEARAMAMASSTSADAGARAAIEAGTAGKKGMPAWMFIGGGVLAAAAAVLAFVAFGGGSSDTAAEGKADSARSAGAASGSASAVAAAEKAPAPVAPPAPTVQPLTVTGIASASDVGAGSASGSGSASAVASAAAPDEAAGADSGGSEPATHKHAGAVAAHDTAAKPAGGDTQQKQQTADTGKDTQTAKGGGGAAAGSGSKKDDLDGAVLGAGDKDELGIGDVMNDSHKKKDTAPAATELSDKDMRAGLSAIEGKAKACYDKYQITGTAKVKLSIDPSGHVSKATALGDFAGTPTGDCVVAAVKTASFPPWTGGPTSTLFVVLLSD